MKKLSSRMKFLAVVAVCSFLFLPAVSSADEVFGPVDFGVGTHSKTFYLGAKTMSFSAAPALKSLSISVQNGSGKAKDRPSSAVVTVNDEDIFVQKDFNQNVTPSSLIRSILVDDPAMDRVEVKVKVNGRKDTRLSVTITAIYEETAPPVLSVPYFLDTDVPPNYWGGPITAMSTIDTLPPFDPRGIWVLNGGDVR
jgi:hypothetical protein